MLTAELRRSFELSQSSAEIEGAASVFCQAVFQNGDPTYDDGEGATDEAGEKHEVQNIGCPNHESECHCRKRSYPADYPRQRNLKSILKALFPVLRRPAWFARAPIGSRVQERVLIQIEIALTVTLENCRVYLYQGIVDIANELGRWNFGRERRRMICFRG